MPALPLDTKKQRALREVLQQHLPHILPNRLPGGFDRVGDIAVVSIVPELELIEQELGAVLLVLHRTLRVVAKRDGIYNGAYRTRPLRVIAGEQRLTTVHRENGITLHLDLGQVYFSVRLAQERARIAALVQPDERVVVLCSGIGPFPLVIGRHSQASEVIGIEQNPVAHGYALRNLAANRAIRTVSFYEGNASTALPGCDHPFDRVLIMLPHGGAALLPHALELLRPGGVLHFYAMQANGCQSATLATVAAACRMRHRAMRPITILSCGHCGPSINRICLDAIIDSA